LKTERRFCLRPRAPTDDRKPTKSLSFPAKKRPKGLRLRFGVAGFPGIGKSRHASGATAEKGGEGKTTRLSSSLPADFFNAIVFGFPNRTAAGKKIVT
jgi:hypothetical protein